MKANKSVVVVDDEKGICDGVESILEKEGYAVQSFLRGADALEYLGKNINVPSYVLLDVWMPDMDGNAVLKKIYNLYKNKKVAMPQVVVMSGHVDNNASADLIKNGAIAFLEKPFTQDTLLNVFSKEQASLFNNGDSNLFLQNSANNFFSGKYAYVEETSELQKTLASAVVQKGIGIHSGSNTGVILSPLKEDSGIVFQELSTNKKMHALVQYVNNTSYSTAVENGGFSIVVVEHLLSALNGFGIGNVKIKANKEIPILDGSAFPFCALIKKAGVVEQKKRKRRLVVKKKVVYEDEKDPTKTITIEPYDGLFIDYNLFVSKEFGEQQFSIDLSEDMNKKYVTEISPCRTFGFLEETQKLQGFGFARGANLGNSLLLHENKVINSNLKFNNEFARHKILDILGDMYLLNGLSLAGKITARGTGHRHNCELLKKLLT